MGTMFISFYNFVINFGSRGGAVVRALNLFHMMVKFVVGFHPCSTTFFSGYSSFAQLFQTGLLLSTLS